MIVPNSKGSWKLFLFLSFTINSLFFNYALAEEDVCFLYAQKNYTRSPILGLEPSVKVFETRLIFNLPSDRGILIQSVKLTKPNCEVIICEEKHLQGECVRFPSSLHDISLQDKKVHKNVKSVDCHCSEPDNPPTVPEDSSLKIVKSDKIQNENPCATLHREWHYKGQSHSVMFPGSAGKIDLGSTQQIRSISVKSGCTLKLWGCNKLARDEVVSISISNSTSFLKMKSTDNFDWACCSCDECSESVCQNAQASSKHFEKVDARNNNLDFSQFVKYGKKIIGIGRNYRWETSELAKVFKIPEQPIVFLKPSTSYITEGQLIELPESLGTIFYELELGVVIGKSARNISETEALDYVAGYFLALDMTAKEFVAMNKGLPWEIGKGFDTACPVGNFIPKSFIQDPNNLSLECKINGEVTQSDNTSKMIFNVQQLISYISKYMTLEPYDVILTGTPDGFGALKSGDVVEGKLGNLTSITFTAIASY